MTGDRPTVEQVHSAAPSTAAVRATLHQTVLTRTRRFVQDYPVIWLLVGSVVFGALMGSRAEFSEPWQRAVVAAAAGAVLGLVIASLRRLVARSAR